MYDQAITLGVQALVFTFFYAALGMRKEHAPMQILFIAMGFFFTVLNLDIMRQAAAAQGQTGIASTIAYGYNATIYIATVVLVYFIVLFLVEVFTRFRSPENVV